ncbi:MAG: hypothetical protein WAX69_04810 [Victivallales bacterium]
MIEIVKVKDGLITGFSLKTDDGAIEYPFHRDGPWAMGVSKDMADGDIEISTCVKEHDDSVEIVISATSKSDVPCRCGRLRFISGLDMHMTDYPAYMDKFMPTSLGLEQKHFWSLFGTPAGKWFAIVSPDQVESFEIFYDTSLGGVRRNGFRDGGHQIWTVSIDLINSLDKRPLRLPPSNPIFKPMESRVWHLHLVPLADENEIGEKVSKLSGAPYLEWIRSGAMPGGEIECRVFMPPGTTSEIVVHAEACDRPEIHTAACSVLSTGVTMKSYSMRIPSKTETRGRDVSLTVTSNDKTISGTYYVFDHWDSYVHCASAFAMSRRPPAATKVCEAAMPVMSILGAQRLLPSASRKLYATTFLCDELFVSAYTPEGDPLMNPGRIQNNSCMIDICREAWLATGEEIWLDKAERLARHLLVSQKEDGGFYAHSGRQHYTCVYYIAKSLLDLDIAERLAASGMSEEMGKKRMTFAGELRNSVAMAMEDLYRRGADVGTEGAPCYEDGAISCSALQLAFWSVVSGDRKHAVRAEEIMEGHRCLEWRGAQAVTNGATIRFWESFWAIGWHNCLNTPHGWSAWTGYAWYYLYLSTGRILYLDRFINNLASCLHLLNTREGDVFFCYSPECHVFDDKGGEHHGECLLSSTMPGVFEEGGSETHEIVKLILDTVMFNGYIYHDGKTWRGLNVRMEQDGDVIRIYPGSARIRRIFLNAACRTPGRELDLSGFSGELVEHGKRQEEGI